MEPANRPGAAVPAAPAPARRWPAALLWASFVLVHAWLWFLNLGLHFAKFGDVSVLYRFWAEQAAAGDIIGIDGPFVYPIGALVPILAAAVFGLELYGVTWLALVTILDLAAFWALVRTGRGRRSAILGWWWVAFLVLLGPIALGRIDAVTMPVAVAGVALIATRPRIAAALLTVGAWIKVWPAALVLAMVLARADRVRIAATAIGTSAVVIALALLAGSGANVLSFVTMQAGRGLQVEAPVTTPWLWMAAVGGGNAAVYYDTGILTFQVRGQGVDGAASLMTPLLALAVIAVCVFGVLALRRGVGSAALLPPLALALVTALIVFNKVGSPQFMTWLAAPVLLGLAVRASTVSFRVPAAIVLAAALLTQLLYPLFYDQLLRLDPVMLTVLTVRNVLLVALLFWAVGAIGRLVRDRLEESLLSKE